MTATATATTVRPVRILVCLLLVAAALLGATPGAAAAQPVASVSFSIASGTSAADEAYVREGIALAERQVREVFGGRIADDLVVNVRNTYQLTAPGLVAYAAGDFLVVFVGSPAWQMLPPALRIQVVVHEYIHVYEMDELGDTDDISPAWLVEGLSQLYSYDAIARLGIIRATDAGEYARWQVGVEREQLPTLYALETSAGFDGSDSPATYDLAHLATEQLLGRNADARIQAYFALVLAGEPWREAFPVAFGVSLETFYERFDRWVDEMIAPRQPPLALSALVPTEEPAPVALRSATSPVAPGQQLLVLGETASGATCRFELRDAEHTRLLRVPTWADLAGGLFWLATVPADATPGPATVVASCGGERGRIPLEIGHGT